MVAPPARRRRPATLRVFERGPARHRESDEAASLVGCILAAEPWIQQRRPRSWTRDGASFPRLVARGSTHAGTRSQCLVRLPFEELTGRPAPPCPPARDHGATHRARA